MSFNLFSYYIEYWCWQINFMPSFKKLFYCGYWTSSLKLTTSRSSWGVILLWYKNLQFFALFFTVVFFSVQIWMTTTKYNKWLVNVCLFSPQLKTFIFFPVYKFFEWTETDKLSRLTNSFHFRGSFLKYIYFHTVLNLLTENMNFDKDDFNRQIC